MGRRHTNRRGKKSRSARKSAFRSHDPELNPNLGKQVIMGRNAAPAKTDESVLKTIPNVKVREDTPPPAISTPDVVETREPKPSLDRHAELRKRGEEKRRLMATLIKPKVTEPKVTPSTLPTTLTPAEPKKSRFAPGELNPSKRKNKRKIEALFENVDSADKKISNSVIDGPEKPTLNTIHSEHKRKKMRDRERAKREKLRLKKEAKAQKHKSMISTKTKVPKLNEALERPADSIRQMGLLLAKKLGKEASSLKSAYDSISKNRE